MCARVAAELGTRRRPRTADGRRQLAAEVAVLWRLTEPRASGASIARLLGARPATVYEIIRALKAAEKLFPSAPEGLRPATPGRPRGERP